MYVYHQMPISLGSFEDNVSIYIYILRNNSRSSRCRTPFSILHNCIRTIVCRVRSDIDLWWQILCTNIMCIMRAMPLSYLIRGSFRINVIITDMYNLPPRLSLYATVVVNLNRCRGCHPSSFSALQKVYPSIKRIWIEDFAQKERNKFYVA